MFLKEEIDTKALKSIRSQVFFFYFEYLKQQRWRSPFKKMLKQSLGLTIIFSSLYKGDKENIKDTQTIYNIYL